jgi:hypothetical protein
MPIEVFTIGENESTGYYGGLAGWTGVQGVTGYAGVAVMGVTGAVGWTGIQGYTGSNGGIFYATWTGGGWQDEPASNNINVFMVGETHNWNSNSGYSRRRNELPFATNEAIMAGARSCNFFASYVIGGPYTGIFHDIVDRIPLRSRIAFSRLQGRARRAWNHIWNRIWFA